MPLSVPWIISAMLGVSMIASFVERHAVHYGPMEFAALPKRIAWGTFTNGAGDRRWYLFIRVPGIRWEVPTGAWIMEDRPKARWCMEYAVWLQESREGWKPHGWRREYVGIENG